MAQQDQIKGLIGERQRFGGTGAYITLKAVLRQSQRDPLAQIGWIGGLILRGRGEQQRPGAGATAQIGHVGLCFVRQ